MVMDKTKRQPGPPDPDPAGDSDGHADGWGSRSLSRSLWFSAPMADADHDRDQDRRVPLTRQRVVAAALTAIAEDGIDALTMRTLAARLGVVPGALYRHIRNKEQLQDLALDAVLAEVDCDLDAALPWTEQVTLLAQRLRAVLEDHPGAAGLLKTRDPLGPHSLAVAEAFLQPLQTAGFPHPERAVGLAFFLIIDYTTGFALASTRTAVTEQRVRDAATRTRLHAFFRSLPADRFPALVALGEHIWLDNRDQRFATGLDILIDGLNQRATPHRTPIATDGEPLARRSAPATAERREPAP
jgi:AcrR family transcriptional regulator